MRCCHAIILVSIVQMTCVMAAADLDALSPPLPAAPGRGYAMRPAIAGDQLVFVSEGDVWSARLGKDLSAPIHAMRLTSGTGTETAPVLSPDGTLVAFSADYDGTPELYVMAITGGAPTRLTFHPSMERPLTFSPDGSSVIYRSDRANALGRNEMWSVPVTGGVSEPLGIGEGSQASIDPQTGRMAFTPWSNEHWNWKRYRGGTAPDVWIADADRKKFSRLTTTRENELFPMWLQGRVWFLSDTDGVMNLWSDRPEGGDRRQHTSIGPNEIDANWAKADPARNGSRIVFTRGADVVLFDAKDGSQQTLDLRLIGDRFADRLRIRSPMDEATAFSLAPEAENLLIESRGEFMVIPLGAARPSHSLPANQVPGRGATRERGAAWMDQSKIAYVTDRDDGYALVVRDLSDSKSEESLLATSTIWLHDPVASSEGTRVAWGDKAGVLRVIDCETSQVAEVDHSVNGAIRDYRFSPDGQWLAWTRPLANGHGQIVVRNLQSGETAPIGHGMTNDSTPRWDPAGAYMYFLSNRHIDPVMDEVELNFANFNTSVVCVLPLKTTTPPPSAAEAREAEFDLEAWATGQRGAGPKDSTELESDEAADDAEAEAAESGDTDAAAGEEATEAPEKSLPIQVDLSDMQNRVSVLPIEPGIFDGFEAAPGALLLGRRPLEGVATEVWPRPPLGIPGTHLEKFDILKEKSSPFVESPLVAWCVDNPATHVATWDGASMRLLDVSEGDPASGESQEDDTAALNLAGITMDVDPRLEWRQIFDESWRLQRDFFWRRDMGGVDWAAVRQRYLPLVDRVGTRDELNELLGIMSSELANSHVYIDGGDSFRQAEPVSIGTMGAELQRREDGWVIARVLPDQSSNGGPASPLAAPFRAVKSGTYVLEVDGKPIPSNQEFGAALVGRGGKPVLLTLADAADGTHRRVVEVILPESDTELRYLDWVETNRRLVEQQSKGRLGYMHLPDMDTAGLTAFIRTFYPQANCEGMVVDIRNNGGGYVSSVLVERLARKPWSYTVPREGLTTSNPGKTLVGPIAVLIDQGAGSDGDIFPDNMRSAGIGTLIGTRTWGGVIGIDMDKGFVDGGMSSQPGYGHWTATRGYAIENEGVSPDIMVELTPADRAAGRDPQLTKAIEVLQSKLPAERFVPPRPETQPPTSPQPK